MWLESWGASAAEVAAPMVGDAVIAGAPLSATRAIDVAAPPTAVFPWLVQMGFGRAGWYSYDWVDNLGRESARELLWEFQQLRAGDRVPGGPIDFVAVVVDAPRAFCISCSPRGVHFTLAFELHAFGSGTRLVSRARAKIAGPIGPFIARRLLGPADGVMVRKQLLGIKERAEALHRAP